MIARSARRGLSSACAASLLWASAAHAEPAEASAQTFEYTTPTQKNYLRAVLELEALTTVSVVWYVIDVRQGGDVGYRWQTFERKLSGSALGHDDNAFGTNFRGHALGGNAYYLSARGNHLGIGESLGFAVAGALLWEYFGEISEVVSANDLIYTPFSGIGIGEPLTQFAAFFDRQRPTLLNRVLGSALGPIKSANDALDGASLSRTASERSEWHRFRVAGSYARARERPSQAESTSHWRDEVRIELSERLARLYDFEGASDRAEFFDDGNLSDMSLRGALGEHGASDFAFAADVVPFGYFQRQARQRADGLHGGGFVLGFEMGFRYLVHDYGGGPAHSLDRAAFVQPLGAMFEYRAEFGPVAFSSKLDVAGTYGGVHPIASDAFGERSALPSVLRHFDYYFGAGAELEAALALRVGRLEAEGSLLGRAFGCVDEHVHLPIRDAWQRIDFGLGLRVQPPWTLRLVADDTTRSGRLGSVRAARHESSLGLEARATF